MKDLIDSVIERESVSEGEEGEDTSLESIIGFGDVDLSFTIDENESRGDENLERQGTKADYVLLNEAGFQYDVFLKQYRSGKIGMLKSLMKISQRTGALYAAILAKQDDNWVLYDSVGFDKERTNNIVLRQSEDFYKRFLAQRQPIMFDLDQAQGHLHNLVSERDKEYIRAVLFIPAIFQGVDAFLYLGLKSVAPDVNGIIKALSQM